MYFVTVGYSQHLEIYFYFFPIDPNSVNLKCQKNLVICANFVTETSSPKMLAKGDCF